jgi:hypothetical protein
MKRILMSSVLASMTAAMIAAPAVPAMAGACGITMKMTQSKVLT